MDIVESVSTSESSELAKEINSCRETVLKKEFGEKISSSRVQAVKEAVTERLNNAPEASGELAKFIPGKETILLCVDGTLPSEMFVVSLKRHYEGNNSKDDVRVHRRFVDVINQSDPKAPERLTVTDNELELLFLKNPKEKNPIIWVNLFNSMEENERVNLDFIGECNANGISSEKLNELSIEDKKRMGMFTIGYPLLAQRELRNNNEDLMIIGLVETVLKSGEQVSRAELTMRSNALLSSRAVRE